MIDGKMGRLTENTFAEELGSSSKAAAQRAVFYPAICKDPPYCGSVIYLVS
jgi:hypothetical protein